MFKSLDNFNSAPAKPKLEKEALKELMARMIDQISEGDFDLEEMETITGIPMEQLILELKLIDPSLSLTLDQIQASILKKIEEKPGNDSNILTIIRDKFKSPTLKFVFAALMMFAKFAPELQAKEGTALDKERSEDKTELVKEKSEVDDGKTYYSGDKLDSKISFEDFQRHAQLDLSNYFDTDLADISEENRTEIINSFIKFLETINNDNFSKISETDFKILASCDERATNKEQWQGQNKYLALARGEAVVQAFYQALVDYDFSQSGLNKEQIEILKNKEFKIEIPREGEEEGVTYISNLINPDSNEKYSAEEIEDIKNNDSDLYQKLLAQCRYVKADFLSEKVDNLEKIATIPAEFKIELKGELKTIDNPLLNFNDYEQVILAFDNSQSMKASAETLAKFIAQQEPLQETKLSFKTYSKTLDPGEIIVNDLKEITDLVKTMEKTGDSQERAVQSALEILESLENGEKKLLVIAGDEAIQGLNYKLIQKLKAEALEKNAELIFAIAHKRGLGNSELIKITDLEKAYFNQFWEEMNHAVQVKLNQQESQLLTLKNTLDRNIKVLDYERQRLEKSGDKQMEAKVAARNDKINDCESQIKEIQLIVESLKTAQEQADPVALNNILEKLGFRYSSRLFKVGGGLGQRFATID